MNGPLCYIRVEGVNFARCVYDTNDLSTTRGGNLLLLEACRFLEGKVIKSGLAEHGSVEELYRGSSEALVRCVLKEGIDAVALEAAIARWLRTEEPFCAATFVVGAYIPDQTAPLSQVFARLRTRGRFRQLGSPSLRLPRWNQDPGLVPCPIDLRRPADRDAYLPDGTQTRLSDNVALRRDYGRDQRKEFYKFLDNTKDTLATAQSFADIVKDPPAAWAHLAGKVAVFYADGNSFGKLSLRVAGQSDAYRAFNLRLRTMQENLVLSLLAHADRHPSQWKDKGKYRLETLLWGGDEVIWVVPAWCGWDLARYFFKETRAWFLSETDKTPLTHGVGLVFANHKAPIQSLLSLARALAEKAKEAMKRSVPEDRPLCDVLDYEVLESFDTLGCDIAKARGRRCSGPKIPSPEEWPLGDRTGDRPRACGERIEAALLALGAMRKEGLTTADYRRCLAAWREGGAGDWEKGMPSAWKDFKALDEKMAPYHLHQFWDYAAWEPSEVQPTETRP